MRIKKARVKKNKAPIESTSARPSRKQDKEKGGDAEKELFGVHIINSEDIENHFGTFEKKTSDATVGESKTELSTGRRGDGESSAN